MEKKSPKRAGEKDVWHAKLTRMFAKTKNKKNTWFEDESDLNMYLWILQNKIRLNFIHKISTSRFALFLILHYLGAYVHISPLNYHFLLIQCGN